MKSVRVNRDDLLQQLESVQPGLSPKEHIEQSSCFAFKDGKVMTYNDEVACSHDCSLKIEGAVKAVPLLEMLRKMKEEELELTPKEEVLIVKGKRREAGVRMESTIQLPIDSVEPPAKWKKLPEGFTDAVSMVQTCASTDQSEFVNTCVHIHPEWVEACDNFQVSRYYMEMGIKKPTIIRRNSLKPVVGLDVIEYSLTSSWIHFRNAEGLVISCRRWTDDYPDYSPFVNSKGKVTVLPKGLADAAEKAQVFSSENADENQVLLELKPGGMRITGRGASGYFREMKSLKYEGKSLAFNISPALLIEITKRHNECRIAPGTLKVDGGTWVYVACLGEVKEEKKSKASKE